MHFTWQLLFVQAVAVRVIVHRCVWAAAFSLLSHGIFSTHLQASLGIALIVVGVTRVVRGLGDFLNFPPA